MILATISLFLIFQPDDLRQVLTIPTSPAETYSCAVTNASTTRPTFNLSCTLNGRMLWNTARTTEGPLNESPQLRLIGRAGPSVLNLSLAVPNWNETWLWVASTEKTRPVVIRHRSEERNVIVPVLQKNDSVGRIIVYDKWIGGTPRSRKRNGKILDRWEQVTTYRVSKSGFTVVSVRNRLIRNEAGGPADRNHLYMRRVH